MAHSHPIFFSYGMTFLLSFMELVGFKGRLKGKVQYEKCVFTNN